MNPFFVVLFSEQAGELAGRRPTQKAASVQPTGLCQKEAGLTAARAVKPIPPSAPLRRPLFILIPTGHKRISTRPVGDGVKPAMKSL